MDSNPSFRILAGTVGIPSLGDKRCPFNGILSNVKQHRFRDISTEEALERGGERGEFGGACGNIRRVRSGGISSEGGELLRPFKKSRLPEKRIR
jgi:hypothetical protein